jgi:hypothetical protein
MRNRRVYATGVAVLVAACGGPDQAATGPERLVLPVFAHEAGQAHQFRTHMTGAEEVPPNATRARGQTTLAVGEDGSLSYRLIVANIHNVTQAHIHLAPSGANGPVVAWLYPSAPPPQLIPGRSQGVLAEGTITEADLVGPLAGAPMAQLLAEIRAGNAYVNVHTERLPPGEIRGQID